MNILVTGANGLIGIALVSRLSQSGHSVVPLRRAAARGAPGPTWNPETGEIKLEAAFPINAVVHLAGENIAQLWTAAAKARIRAGSMAGHQPPDIFDLLLELSVLVLQRLELFGGTTARFGPSRRGSVVLDASPPWTEVHGL